MLSFRDYIVHHAERADSPEGDFVEDARYEISQGRFPEVDTWKDLIDYLHRQRACREAGIAAWRVYITYRKQNPRENALLS